VAACPSRVAFLNAPPISIFPAARPIRYAARAMFDVIKEQLRTAADKLTHLRRFL
jgi:hypothetical protein